MFLFGPFRGGRHYVPKWMNNGLLGDVDDEKPTNRSANEEIESSKTSTVLCTIGAGRYGNIYYHRNYVEL